MSRSRRGLGFVATTTGFFWAATAIAIWSFWPIYEDTQFVVMAVVTVLAGTTIALLGERFGLRSSIILLMTVVAFLALGVPLAVPSGAVGGFLPTPDSLLELVEGVALGWRQLLTITLPVGTYQALLVPAFTLILVSTVVGLSVAVRARFGELGVIAPSFMLLVGLAFGPQLAPAAIPLVLGFLVVAMAWFSWCRWYRRRQAVRSLSSPSAVTASGASRTESAERLAGFRSVVSAAVILVLAVTAGALTVGLVPPSNEREVLRDSVAIEFDPQDQVSPLSSFRSYLQPERADEPLFSVTGLPAGARLRVATLDSYDGVVYSVGSSEVTSASGSFTRVPTSLDQSAVAGASVRVAITIADYEGIWMPTVGKLESVDFQGDDAGALTASFFYNDVGGTAVALDGLKSGDGYTLEAKVDGGPLRGDIPEFVPGTAIVPAPTGIPEELSAVLDGWVRGVEAPGERLQYMLAGMAEDGYVSHGVAEDEAPSRSGHGADRITELLSDGRMIGDEEQYAVTAALMARAIGFPSRVVFGFAPEGLDGASDPISGSTIVRGGDVSAWIEINTLRSGWVAIDPMPPEREIPEEEPEEPAEVARPQTPIPPAALEPDPPSDQAPIDGDQDDEPGVDPLMEALLAALRVIGITLLVLAILLSPFLAIVAAKLRRRYLRQQAPTPAARISGGWQEFEDTVTDYGLSPPPAPTRSEVAETVGGLQPLILASVADRAVFAPEQVDQYEADQVWAAVHELNAELGGTRTRWQRLKALISLRSLGGYSVKELFARERRLP